MKVEIGARALADLEDIAAYIARDNPQAAEAWVDRLLETAEKAALQPLGGRVVPEIGDPTLREVFLRSYRVVYRVEPERILVVTILEGHRRLRREVLR